MHRLTHLLILGIFTVTWLGCSQPEDIASAQSPLYVDNHVGGGHGPLPVGSTMPTWGVVQLCDTHGDCEGYLGNVDGSYVAYPSTGMYWIARSSAPYTYAVAYEHHDLTGRTYVVTSSWVPLSWTVGAVSIQYDDACPHTPGMDTVHQCTGTWTPMDSSGVPTYVIANGIPKPGLPYGDYLKDTSGTGAGSWCTFNFSEYPSVPKPAGVPDHGVAVDACP